LSLRAFSNLCRAGVAAETTAAVPWQLKTKNYSLLDLNLRSASGISGNPILTLGEKRKKLSISIFSTPQMIL